MVILWELRCRGSSIMGVGGYRISGIIGGR